MKDYTITEAREIFIRYLDKRKKEKGETNLGNCDCDNIYCRDCLFNRINAATNCNYKILSNEYISKAEEEINKDKVDWSKVPVDMKILIRTSEDDEWQKSYFAKYEDGAVQYFVGGCTSWSNKNTYYVLEKNAKLYVEGEE